MDIILAIPLLWGAYKGFTKGLIIEIASIIGLVAGVYFAVHFSFFAEELLSDYFDNLGKMLPLVSFALTFIAVVMLVYLLAKLIEKVVDLVALKLINKLLGLLFGMIKAALIFSALLFITDTIDASFHFIPENQKSESKLYPLVQPIIPTLVPAIKEFDLMEKVEKEVENKIIEEIEV